MIRLVVGLGNPGQQYEKTRHNAGFLFLDELVSEFGGQWSMNPVFEAYIAEIFGVFGKVLLLKPNTYMNRSGSSVGKVARYYKFLPQEILVVHDEIDLGLGVLKIKVGGGHAGHNGLRDIVAHLGSADFVRLRLGVGRPAKDKAVADYVLSVPSVDEMAILAASINKAKENFAEILKGNFSLVAEKLNA